MCLYASKRTSIFYLVAMTVFRRKRFTGRSINTNLEKNTTLRLLLSGTLASNTSRTNIPVSTWHMLMEKYKRCTSVTAMKNSVYHKELYEISELAVAKFSSNQISCVLCRLSAKCFTITTGCKAEISNLGEAMLENQEKAAQLFKRDSRTSFYRK